MGSALELLAEQGVVNTDVPIGGLTTYKLGGSSRYFADVEDLDALTSVGKAAKADRIPVLMIGRGSNLLIADSGFEGLAVRLVGAFTTIEISGATVIAGGAVGLPQLARRAARAGRGGLEWCVGVPGSVGGGVVMNAGCFGSDVADVLVEASIHDLTSGDTTTAKPSDLAMGYRTTALRSSDVVIQATFDTSEVAVAEAERSIREITRWRRDHQPAGTFNAGSVFKNPEGDAAGRLIDSIGLKGMRRGEVRVSDRHANFFVAGPGACAQDVFDLLAAVQGEVFRATGVNLEPEVRLVGSFEPSDEGAVA